MARAACDGARADPKPQARQPWSKLRVCRRRHRIRWCRWPGSAPAVLEDGGLGVVAEHLLQRLPYLALGGMRAGTVEQRVHQVAVLLRRGSPKRRQGAL